MRAAHPDERFGIRVDTGVQEGGEIPVYYDSMIAKLIVHAPDRMLAIEKMREALNAFSIRHCTPTSLFGPPLGAS
jgi:propionyl-CoA carboxylase alpha chain